MDCASCGYANAPDARFCTRCGVPTARTCPACGTAAAPEDRFCGACGTALAAPTDGDGDRTAGSSDLARYVPEALWERLTDGRGGAVRGERRTVTMLFADIDGSTAAAEHLDPEEWAEVVNDAFERLIPPVHRYDGTLARLQGDAVLAFFGAPVAHEDDPVRAVRAGLEMLAAIEALAPEVRRRTDLDLTVRVGINTGLVVVGEVGSDLRAEYTALGDAINVAARMEQTAAPGTVRISARTARLLGEVFVLEDLGPVTVRGRARPVGAFRVVAPAEGARSSAEHPPLVGREVDRWQLRAAMDALLAGDGGVVTIVGDAGLGKSRLVAELFDDARARAHVAVRAEEPGELAWLEGRCRSFDREVPYAPFLDVAVRWLGIRDPRRPGADPRTDEGRSAYDVVATTVRDADPAAEPDDLAALAQLVGAELPDDAARLVESMETPALHERITAAIVRYLEAEAGRRPLLLVLEDLHWADALSLALVEQLLSVTPRVPMSLVLVMRPAREDPSWRLIGAAATVAPDRATPIQLHPLPPDAAGELLDALTADRGLSPAQRRDILARADGNPLFLEEMARAVADGADGEVPVSLASLLAARLDRLDPATRAVVEFAAVVGREFEPAPLGEVAEHPAVETALADLVTRGILTERRSPNGRRFAFRHALIQEVAYQTILLKHRRELHGRVARYLERHRPGTAADIARHHLASDTPAAALPWAVEAGRRAARVMALGDAIHWYSRAVEVAPPDADPELVARAHEGLGEAHGMVPDLDRSTAAYQSLAAFGRSCARPNLEVRALNRLGLSAANIAGDFSAAEQYLQQAREVAEAAGDEHGLAEYHLNSCFVSAVRGDLAGAIGHDEETARIGRSVGAEDLLAEGLVRRLTNLVNATRFDEIDEEQLAEARAAVDALGDRGEELRLTLEADVAAPLRERVGDLAGALEILGPVADAMERHGSFYAALNRYRVGRLTAWGGDVEAAISVLGAARRLAERRKQAFVVASAAATLAEVYARCGDRRSSEAQRAVALPMLREPLGEFFATAVWTDLGVASLELGEPARAEADLRAAAEVSSILQFWDRPRHLAAAATAAAEQGALARAAELAGEAGARTGHDGMLVVRPHVGRALARIATLSGDLDRADGHLAEAATDAATFGLRLLGQRLAAERADLAAVRGDERLAAEQHRVADALADALLAAVVDPSLRAGLARRLRPAAGAVRQAPA